MQANVITCLVIGLLTLGCGSREATTVSDAWIRALPPTSRITAAYMTIRHEGTETITLVGASCEIADTVQIHETTIVDGVMQMRGRAEITIEPNSTLELQPGGVHLMLLGLRRAVQPDEVIPVRLRFSDGEVVVQATVRRGEEVERR